MSTQTPRDFRPLNPLELAAIEGARRKGRLPEDSPLYTDTGRVQVSYEGMQGGFTVCVLALEVADGIILWRGASRRNYRDARNATRGEMLAFSRAVLYSRPAAIQRGCSRWGVRLDASEFPVKAGAELLPIGSTSAWHLLGRQVKLKWRRASERRVTPYVRVVALGVQALLKHARNGAHWGGGEDDELHEAVMAACDWIEAQVKCRDRIMRIIEGYYIGLVDGSRAIAGIKRILQLGG